MRELPWTPHVLRRWFAVLSMAVLANCDARMAPEDATVDAFEGGIDAMDRTRPIADVVSVTWDALPDPADASLPTTCSWTEVQTRVLQSCGGFGCHDAPGAAGLVLDATHAYGSLVGVASTTVPRELRVRPGDPDHSFLWRKLTNRLAPDGGEGFPMPRDEGGTDWLQLSPDELRLVYCWILNGAVEQ